MNAAKLVDVGFRQLGRGQTVDDVVEENALPEKELPLVDGLRAMEERMRRKLRSGRRFLHELRCANRDGSLAGTAP